MRRSIATIPRSRTGPCPAATSRLPLAYGQWIVLASAWDRRSGSLCPSQLPCLCWRSGSWGWSTTYPPYERRMSLPRRAVGGGEQPDPNAGRLVYRVGFACSPVSPAAKLLDGRLLLHGDQAIRRNQEHQRSQQRVAAYRRRSPSFDEPRMLVAIMFYAARLPCCSSVHSSCGTDSS